MIIERVTSDPFQENSYLIRKDGSLSCLVIDPGDEPEKIIHLIDQNNLDPIAIINTHAHLDHIGGVSEIKSHYQVPFYLHPDEKSVLDGYTRDCTFFGMIPKETPKVDHWFKNKELKLGDFEIKLFETPGHTPGGTCLIVKNHVFTGDTIFAGSVGRTDLPGGDWDTLCNSLVKVMRNIPADYILHPGHGSDTTLNQEMAQNPFLISLLNRVNF